MLLGQFIAFISYYDYFFLFKWLFKNALPHTFLAPIYRTDELSFGLKLYTLLGLN